MAKRKSLGRRLFTLLALAIIIPFAYPFGSPMLSLNMLRPSALKQIFAQSKAEIATAEEATPASNFTMDKPQLDQSVTVYRWRDENGSWSFGSRPPADGTPYKEITVQADANLIPAIATGEKEQEATASLPGATEKTDNSKGTELMGYSVNDINKIMQSAKEARESMQQYYQQQQQAIGQSMQ